MVSVNRSGVGPRETRNRGAERAAGVRRSHGLVFTGSVSRRMPMLKWALILAIVALIAGALGFGGIAGVAAGIAKLLFFVAVVGFLIFLALGVFAGRKIM